MERFHILASTKCRACLEYSFGDDSDHFLAFAGFVLSLSFVSQRVSLEDTKSSLCRQLLSILVSWLTLWHQNDGLLVLYLR